MVANEPAPQTQEPVDSNLATNAVSNASEALDALQGLDFGTGVATEASAPQEHLFKTNHPQDFSPVQTVEFDQAVLDALKADCANHAEWKKQLPQSVNQGQIHADGDLQIMASVKQVKYLSHMTLQFYSQQDLSGI